MLFLERQKKIRQHSIPEKWLLSKGTSSVIGIRQTAYQTGGYFCVLQKCVQKKNKNY